MRLPKFPCISVLIAVMSGCYAAEEQSVNSSCELYLGIRNVYTMGRGDAPGTYEHDCVRGGVLVRVNIDSMGFKDLDSCSLYYKFYDVNEERFERQEACAKKASVDRRVDVKPLPMDLVVLDLKQRGGDKQLYLKDIPEPLRTKLYELRHKAGDLLLYPPQREMKDIDYTSYLNDPRGYPHRRSSWSQSFDSEAIRAEPAIHFYNNSLALIEHAYGKELLKRTAPEERPVVNARPVVTRNGRATAIASILVGVGIGVGIGLVYLYANNKQKV